MNRFQKLLLWVTSGLTGLTGAVYFFMDRMMEPVGPWAVVNHPLQPWVLKAHIIVAPALVFSIGLIATEHIWKHYRGRIRRARRTGLATMWMIAPMVLTGYLIQSITHETLLAAVAWAHIVTGVVYLLGVGLHQWALRVARANRVGRPAAIGAPAPSGPGGEGVRARSVVSAQLARSSPYRSVSPRRDGIRSGPKTAT